jgi:hypothetical protein
LAIQAAVPASPAKPKIPAMIATIRNVTGHQTWCSPLGLMRQAVFSSRGRANKEKCLN